MSPTDKDEKLVRLNDVKKFKQAYEEMNNLALMEIMEYKNYEIMRVHKGWMVTTRQRFFDRNGTFITASASSVFVPK